ncbi:MAG: outer membrane beta-barrel protein [Planctomycetota bacterium]
MRTTVLAVLLFLPACAMGPTNYSETGLYVSGGLLRAWDDVDDIEDSDFDLDSDQAYGWDLRAGLRFLNHFAVELMYEDLQQFDFEGAEADLSSIMAQGKLYLLTGIIQPYGLLGIGFVDGDLDVETIGDDISEDETDFMLRGGLGLELFLLPSFSLFAEGAYYWPQDDLEDLNFYTAQVGASLHF